MTAGSSFARVWLRFPKAHLETQAVVPRPHEEAVEDGDCVPCVQGEAIWQALMAVGFIGLGALGGVALAVALILRGLR